MGTDEGAAEITARDRARMVDEQLRARGIRDERVLEAMAAIPREWFIGERYRRRAYADEAVPIDAGQTISQPWIVARMTELLAPRSGDRMLELGTGSGYQAAILAWLGADVLSLERHAELARQARERIATLDLPGTVEIRVADGSLGDPAGAPYDGIIVTAAAPAIPVELRDQLADGGRLVIPVGPRDRQILTLAVRHGNDWEETAHGACVFVPLVGPGGFPEQRFDPFL
jgi:protein-L-isoaspartate(D-aspartate) O-methyltransferase